MEKTANPVISVIIPVYNVEPYLRQALDSVVNQTWRNLQVILVDDGSPDNCGAICDEYATSDNRITVIHKENGGVSSARNAGMNAASGDWIYFMDSDDWLELNTFELALASAEKTGADMVFFAIDYVETKHHYKRSVLRHIDETKEGVWNNLKDIQTFLTFCAGGVSSCIIRFDRIKNMIKFDPNLRAYEDMIFREDCYPYIHSFSYIPNVCYHYRKTPGSATNGRIDTMKYLNDARTRSERLKKCADLFPENELLLDFSCNEYLNAVSRVSRIVFSNKVIPLVEKWQYIQNAVHSPYYEECFHRFKKSFVGKMTRISAMFGRPSFASLYFAYYCRQLYYSMLSLKKGFACAKTDDETSCL